MTSWPVDSNGVAARTRVEVDRLCARLVDKEVSSLTGLPYAFEALGGSVSGYRRDSALANPVPMSDNLASSPVFKGRSRILTQSAIVSELFLAYTCTGLLPMLTPEPPHPFPRHWLFPLSPACQGCVRVGLVHWRLGVREVNGPKYLDLGIVVGSTPTPRLHCARNKDAWRGFRCDVVWCTSGPPSTA